MNLPSSHTIPWPDQAGETSLLESLGAESLPSGHPSATSYPVCGARTPGILPSLPQVVSSPAGPSVVHDSWIKVGLKLLCSLILKALEAMAGIAVYRDKDRSYMSLSFHPGPSFYSQNIFLGKPHF